MLYTFKTFVYLFCPDTPRTRWKRIAG